MLTWLDQIANQNHLQLVKAILPHLSMRDQQMLSVLIKFMELKNVMQYYSQASHSLKAADTAAGPPEEGEDILDILTDVREHCEGKEQEMLDQALQMMSMIELYSLFSEAPGAEN
ncbi:MAG: hypothetical protein LUG93_04580 [Lachnospiraceae bacterium]|nr:hypothetical protein [Lachnospiraceae bacterium]